MSIDLGQTIDGKYRVVRHIGAGGMGTVYEGENVLIGRRVAIKLLHAEVASMPEFVERFEREAKAAVRIGSPHVCDVLDLGHLPNGDRFIVMEYLEGSSLEDRVESRGRLTPQELAPIAFEILEGLGTMHAAGVVHRDLKPANIFLQKTRGGRGETVKILDFGVAKVSPQGAELGSMTQTGAMMGTPLYMSPEQARGARDVDGRSDIYSASVIFYRALTGQLPYVAENLNELLFKIVLEEPMPIRDLVPDVDEAFAEIVHRGLSRDLDKRFIGARVYQEAIAAWGRTQGRASLAFAVTLPTDPPPPPGRRPSFPDGSASSPRASSPSSPGGAVANSATPAGGPNTPAGLGSGPSTPAGLPSRPNTPISAGNLGAAAGTPLSWAGARDSTHAVPVVASSGRMPAAADVAGSLAATQASPSDPLVGSSRNAPAALATSGIDVATAPEPRRKPTLAIVASAALALGALGFALSRGGSATVTPAEGPKPATSSVTVEAPSAPTAVLGTPSAVFSVAAPVASVGSAAPAAEAGATASRPAPPSATPQTGAAVASPSPAVGVTAKPSTSAAAPAVPSLTAAAPALSAPNAAPSSSTHGRRFRTNID